MPIAKNDWVASSSRIGRVKDIHDDGSLDVVLYGLDGSRIGRESPVMGGPSGFEPCCNPAGWKKIAKPKFPLSRLAFIKEVVQFVDD